MNYSNINSHVELDQNNNDQHMLAQEFILNEVNGQIFLDLSEFKEQTIDKRLVITINPSQVESEYTGTSFPISKASQRQTPEKDYVYTAPLKSPIPGKQDQEEYNYISDTNVDMILRVKHSDKKCDT